MTERIIELTELIDVDEDVLKSAYLDGWDIRFNWRSVDLMLKRDRLKDAIKDNIDTNRGFSLTNRGFPFNIMFRVSWVYYRLASKELWVCVLSSVQARTFYMRMATTTSWKYMDQPKQPHLHAISLGFLANRR